MAWCSSTGKTSPLPYRTFPEAFIVLGLQVTK